MKLFPFAMAAPVAAFGPLPKLSVRFGCACSLAIEFSHELHELHDLHYLHYLHDLRSKGAPGQASALHCGGRRVRRLPSSARSFGPSPNSLRSLRSLRSNMRRQVSLRSALRARAETPPRFSAAEAHRHLPEHAFAATLGFFGRHADTVAARADAPTKAGD
jgi:hypothetical protein